MQLIDAFTKQDTEDLLHVVGDQVHVVTSVEEAIKKEIQLLKEKVVKAKVVVTIALSQMVKMVKKKMAKMVTARVIMKGHKGVVVKSGTLDVFSADDLDVHREVTPKEVSQVPMAKPVAMIRTEAPMRNVRVAVDVVHPDASGSHDHEEIANPVVRMVKSRRVMEARHQEK